MSRPSNAIARWVSRQGRKTRRSSVRQELCGAQGLGTHWKGSASTMPEPAMILTMRADDSSCVNSTKDGAGTIVTHTCIGRRVYRVVGSIEVERACVSECEPPSMLRPSSDKPGVKPDLECAPPLGVMHNGCIGEHISRAGWRAASSISVCGVCTLLIMSSELLHRL